MTAGKAQQPPVRALVAGEALIDAVSRPGEPTREYVGGSPANVAFGLGALGHAVDLATWLGDDERGRLVASACTERGVTLTDGSLGAAATSVAHAAIDETGAATYRFDLEWRLPPVADLHRYGHVHTGSIAAVVEPGGAAVRELLAAARAHATTSYDPNARPSLMGEAAAARVVIEECVEVADVVKVSDEDLEWLYPGTEPREIAAAWAGRGPALVVVTMGADGALVLAAATGEVGHVPAPRVAVADTVGAGDSFMAGLVSGLLDAGLLGAAEARERLSQSGLSSFVPAVERALATAAFTVARPGAQAPTRADLVGTPA